MQDNEIMATGRRKTSIAVVKLVPGKGRVFVNGKTFDGYSAPGHKEHCGLF